METSITPTPVIADHLVTVDKNVLAAHMHIVGHIEEFLGNTLNPIWSVNHVLLKWLETSANLSKGSHDREFLESMLSLVTFLSNLGVGMRELNFYEQEAEGKEVGHE
ncbi:hypothetical protein [Spirosoma validum]|uniref:Uncharacterized protein n=1 Tax=Spirosoma validum TaxID=2771355 RepID=A0A927B1E2_9BACT|nr:hypothetical protein [Spirosoma validum]MBD2753769.1 hypothetical protein [Spirosoma validum]